MSLKSQPPHRTGAYVSVAVLTMSAIAESVNARVSKSHREIRPLPKAICIEPGNIIFIVCCTRLYYQMMMKGKKMMMPEVVAHL